MGELRWTLLLIGVVFIVVLALWERRKRRQSPRAPGEPLPGEPGTPLREPTLREPTLTLPEIRAREHFITRELPVVQVADPLPSEPIQIAAPADQSVPELSPAELAPQPSDEPEPEEAVGAVRIVSPEPPANGNGAEPCGEPPVAHPAEPIVDWPPEESRKVIALRLVSSSPERFAGRAVRHALTAEGFVLGRYSIYHKPDAEQRAVLSAASLSKPGNFDPDTIDTQRFGGLSLFAVLPGPRPPRETFEELLTTARNLNERLQGGLQDERGGPLTPTRIASLREGLE
jgi:FtsZ-interacting cell division protein ZipA